VNISDLKELEAKATPSPYPGITIQREMEVIGTIQLPWTTMPLIDYQFCRVLRNLAPELIAWMAAKAQYCLDRGYPDLSTMLGFSGQMDSSEREEDAFDALMAKLKELP
jgi:hypothetical protein